MEWSAQTRYNPFNSYKGLTYYENYKSISDWMQGKGKLLPPIECSIDPISLCNLQCYYCNSQRYLIDEPLGYAGIEKQLMCRLIEFLAQWGVKGVCFGGGGESMLTRLTPEAVELVVKKGMDAAVVTNGTVFHEALAQCRWVAFSVDAGDGETYQKIHGVDYFDVVIQNIQRLVSMDRKCDIAFRALVLPENYNKLFDICRLAEELGVDNFHVRPVDLERKDYQNSRQYNYNIEVIKEQFEKCHELETDSFHVYTVMHKFDNEFHVKHDIAACLASPIVLQCCTNGKCYVCVDHRIEDRFYLGNFAPDPEKILDWWGSDNHSQIVKSIKPKLECSRCTFHEYHKQVESVESDRIHRNFP